MKFSPCSCFRTAILCYSENVVHSFARCWKVDKKRTLGYTAFISFRRWRGGKGGGGRVLSKKNEAILKTMICRFFVVMRDYTSSSFPCPLLPQDQMRAGVTKYRALQAEETSLRERLAAAEQEASKNKEALEEAAQREAAQKGKSGELAILEVRGFGIVVGTRGRIGEIACVSSCEVSVIGLWGLYGRRVGVGSQRPNRLSIRLHMVAPQCDIIKRDLERCFRNVSRFGLPNVLYCTSL